MPAVCEGDDVSAVYDVTATREKGRHLAVSYVVRVPIEGLTNQEQRSRVWMRLPTRPRSIALAEAFAESKHKIDQKSWSASGRSDATSRSEWTLPRMAIDLAPRFACLSTVLPQSVASKSHRFVQLRFEGRLRKGLRPVG